MKPHWINVNKACLFTKMDIAQQPRGKHVKFHSNYLSSYLRQTTRYFNSFIFFLGVLGYCALEKNCKNHVKQDLRSVN